jgi:hypothetical protein
MNTRQEDAEVAPPSIVAHVKCACAMLKCSCSITYMVIKAEVEILPASVFCIFVKGVKDMFEVDSVCFEQ